MVIQKTKKILFNHSQISA